MSVISFRQLVHFIISFRSCQALFSKVFQTLKKLYKVVCFCRSVQATWLLYHKFSRLSTVNLNFLKTILFFSISEAIPCDSLFILSCCFWFVKNFFKFFSNLFQPIYCLLTACLLYHSFKCLSTSFLIYFLFSKK